MKIVSGFAELAHRYRGFLIDQWGVLHDGGRPYPGAVECLARLREGGARIVILSNSGRRGDENARILAAMGFAPDLYDAVVSAGDAARAAIAARADLFHRALGRRCLLLARDSDRDLANGLDLVLTDDVASADFLLLMSIDAPRQSVAGWTSLLERAAKRGLPMVCGNPDLHRVTPEGALIEAPGLVAQRYAELGGTVRSYGKPHRAIYDSCLPLLGAAPGDIIAVGDSLPHDIAGAQGAGLRSAFISSGIHRDALAVRSGEPPDIARLEALAEEMNARPDYALASFAW